MARVYPKDSPQNQAERKSYQILNNLLNTEVWDFRGKENHDHGVDYAYEYIEDGEFRGYRMLAQIKGSRNLHIKDNKITFDFPVKTANYAISCAQPFVFFLVDLSKKTAYYLPLQDYFIANVDKMTALEKNKKTIRVFVPTGNTIDDAELKAVAKSQYTFDEERKLQKVR